MKKKEKQTNNSQIQTTYDGYQREGGRGSKVKAVQHIMTGDDLTLAHGHTMQYTDGIS